MERYYDKKTRSETHTESESTIISTDPRVSWWFKPLDAGIKVAYDSHGLPFKYKGNFALAKVVDGEVVEGEAVEKLLDNEKALKLSEIKKAKKIYQNRDVVSLISDTEYYFFGGLESTRKYSDAMNLALSLGLEEGIIKTREGLVSINAMDMQTALQKLSLQMYYGWLKESHYIASVEALSLSENLTYSQAITALSLITWEDKII